MKKIENLLWIVLALIVVMAVIAASAAIFLRNGSGNYYGPYGMMGGGYAGMIIFMPVIGVLSAAFVLIFIYFFFEMLRGSNSEEHGSNYGQAEKIIRERYARGEISEDDYNRMISNLRK